MTRNPRLGAGLRVPAGTTDRLLPGFPHPAPARRHFSQRAAATGAQPQGERHRLAPRVELLPRLVELGLDPPHPNPFNAETVLEYELPRTQQVELVIYNLLGQLRSLVSATRPPGRHRPVWRGERLSGTVTTGVYFATLATAQGTRVRRLLMLR